MPNIAAKQAAPRVASQSTSPVRVYRVAAGMRQADLAALAGLNPETIRRLELGQNHPQRATRRALADALGVEPELLWPSNDNAARARSGAVQESGRHPRHGRS